MKQLKKWMPRRKERAERKRGDAGTWKERHNLADFIVAHNKGIRNLVLGLLVLHAALYLLVNVNYDLSSYLPDSADSKQAINKMQDIFGYPGTGRLMLKDVTLYEAKRYKNQIEKLDGVDQVVWCDTTTQIYGSSEFIDYDSISEYYLDGDAVMDITFTEGDSSKRTHRAIAEIQKLTGDRGYLVGMSPTNKFIEENVKKEMKLIMSVVVAFIFLILLLTTTSWFEPILFLAVIGCAIVLNKGSNVLLGTISYITNNISDVLQLATSMDYSVFLLHAFERERERGLSREDAMREGLKNTITTILASSMTTFFGFIVLVFMKFKMGLDMGIVMAKGILCSLGMVIFLMPSLLLSCSELIDRTRHRPFLPKFEKTSVVIGRLSPLLLIVSLLLAPPVYIAQGMNHFLYGADATGAGPGTSIYEETREIDEKFGRSNLLVAIVPAGELSRERALTKELESRDYVKKVMGLGSSLPEGVPEEILPASVTELFHKGGYARLLIYLKTKPESEAAYRYTEEVTALIRQYYPEEAYITGNTPTTADMERILIPDYALVNNLAMLSIFVVVALSFHSALLPFAAMIPIMMAIYVNMAFPYLSGNTLIFIAYAVVSCVQLGSTIDYAISSTESYLQIRKTESDKRKSAERMTELSLPSILTSGSILVVCGYAISILSSIPAISEVGHLVGRGAILSVFFVVGMMPVLLRLLDPFITTPAGIRREHRRALVRSAAINARNRRRKMREERRGLLKKAVSGGLLLCLLTECLFPAPAYAAAPKVGVEETLYLNLSPYGEISRANVVKGLEFHSQKSYTDYGSYLSVLNMSNEEAAERSGDAVTWAAPETEDKFFFQGELAPSSVRVPWRFDVSYKVNGVETAAEQLAGSSGLIEMDIDALPEQNCSRYMKDNFLLLVMIPIDRNKVYSVDAPESQRMSFGQYSGVGFTALPGKEAHFVVRMGSDSFESMGAVIMMTPGTAGDIQELRELRELRDRFRTDTDQVLDSTEALMGNISSMSEQLALNRQMLEELRRGKDTLKNAETPVFDGTDRSVQELRALSGSLTPLSDSLLSIEKMLEDINAELSLMDQDMEDGSRRLGKLSESLRELGDTAEGGSRPELSPEQKKELAALEAVLRRLSGRLSGGRQGIASSSELGGLDGTENTAGLRMLLKGLEEQIAALSAAAGENSELEQLLRELSSADMSLQQLSEGLSALSGQGERESLLLELVGMSSELSKLGSDSGAALHRSANLLDELRLLSGDMDAMLDTMNRYHPALKNAVQSTNQTLLSLQGLSGALAGTAEALNSALRSASGSFDAAADAGLTAGMLATENGQRMLENTEQLKKAGQDLRRSVNEKLDEVETESNFLNMDPDSVKESFTSTKNQEPDSLLIVCRTEEISVKKDGAVPADAEEAVQSGSVRERIAAVFRRLISFFAGLFSHKSA